MIFGGKELVNQFLFTATKSEDYRSFGSPFETPACAHLGINSFIVINKNGLDVDIISHELSYAELYARIGYMKRELEIPVWFDEGLAMQVDHRDSYSTDTLKLLSNNFYDLPRIKKMTTYQSFGSGTDEEIQLNYGAAKYEVKNWYTDKKLKMLIKKIKGGVNFCDAYKNN